ncbi:acetyltransferase [Streptomyces sp. CB02009]|uniref:GNAT family N-acetyltransferase n=1 Tax=Streptomyces sp. CB02009 TaxID=1703938 RepID=UPI00093F0E58|nr:GNAT family N-acetyltransferase [Streptomyces sp. CB02009]OKJ49577.1 acetyltransferase [Streptomyces sp. CB02009]
MTPAYALRRYGHTQAAEIRQTLLDVHAEAFAAEMDDPFHDQDRFAWFVDHWSGLPGFDCVIAYDGDEPAGYAYGAPAVHEREWWREYLSPAPATDDTFNLSELMVRPKWRATGLSEQLHAELVGRRPEPLAALLVDVTHPRVQALYESWGYRKIGERQPFADSPVYAVMLRGL